MGYLLSNANVNIVRRPSTSTGIFGTLSTAGFTCITLERPWLGNQSGISCIPVGTYIVEWTNHPIHGNVYQIMDVPDRTDILIHSANVYQELEGCIAVGIEEAIFPGGTIPGVNTSEEGIQHSQQTLANLQAHMMLEPFVLEISNA